MKGKGINTFTSGLELPWTSNPVKWEHEFFKNLVKFENKWVKHLGPAGDGKWQWEAPGAPEAPTVDLKGSRNIGTFFAKPLVFKFVISDDISVTSLGR